MYFPLKRREINTRIESESVSTLTQVVEGLKGELRRKDEQLVELKKGQTDLRERIVNLEKKDRQNGIAISAACFCEYFKNKHFCPILNKKNELDNE